MKILHTSDWHVGKVLKGRDRHDEQVAVLRSIVATARDENVDVVLVAGDLFETAAPAAKAQGLVMRTLLALREDGRLVVVIAGNHDNQALLDAVYRPVLGELGLHVLGTPKRPDSGGLMTLRTRSRELLHIPALPFLSHRPAGRAAPGIRADARPVPVTGGRRLRTLRGTLDAVIAEGEQAGDAYLRVVLAEPGRAGLGDLVRGKLPNTLEVTLDDEHRPRPGTRGGGKPSRVGRSPLQLFGDYLGEQHIEDPRIPRMFAELLDELTGADSSGLAAAGTGKAGCD